MDPSWSLIGIKRSSVTSANLAKMPFGKKIHRLLQSRKAEEVVGERAATTVSVGCEPVYSLRH